MKKCAQCGYIHPQLGKCLVVKNKKMAETEKGRVILNVSSKLSRFLDLSENWRELVKEIEDKYNIGDR